jgi:iron-sulfur cluster assembly protein
MEDSIKNSVTITKAAAEHVLNLLKKRGHGLGLRLGVKKSGCSGYAYKLDFVDETSDHDKKVEKFGATVYINEHDLSILAGLELDFQADKMSAKFIFNNPNVKAACGCGESFAV